MGLFRRSKTESNFDPGTVEWSDGGWNVSFPNGDRITGLASLMDAYELSMGADDPFRTVAAPKFNPPIPGSRSDYMPEGAVSEYLMDSGRWLRVGTEFSVVGEPGRFVARWIKDGQVTAYGGREGHGSWRAFRLEDVRRIHTKNKVRTNAGLVHAHQSPDPSVVSHCPSCGSGDIVARSDGSVECVFCSRTFTIAEQPMYSAMPGQPGAPTDAAVPSAPVADEAVLDGTPSFVPPEGDQGVADPAEVEAALGKAKPFQVFTGHLVTHKGDKLTEDYYVTHLALRHGNRRTVLSNLRGK